MAKCPKISIPQGADVAVVRVTGNPKNQEPTHVRIAFPGGELDLARVNLDPNDASKVEYWAHIRVNRKQDVLEAEEGIVGKIVDARLDIVGKHASETDIGDFEAPDLYHLAVRITPAK